MGTSIDIVNQGLSHLGNKANVSSIDPPDGSVESYWASRYYFTAVYRALARMDWSFARTRGALGAVDLPESTTWTYAYAKPSDCLVPRRITTGDTTQYEDDSAAFELEGETILCNTADAVLIYTQPVTDAAKFPVLFGDVVSLDLAAYVAGPLLRGKEGIDAANALRQAAAQMTREAGAVEGNTSRQRPSSQHTPGSVAARGTSLWATASTWLRS